MHCLFDASACVSFVYSAFVSAVAREEEEIVRLWIHHCSFVCRYSFATPSWLLTYVTTCQFIPQHRLCMKLLQLSDLSFKCGTINAFQDMKGLSETLMGYWLLKSIRNTCRNDWMYRVIILETNGVWNRIGFFHFYLFIYLLRLNIQILLHLNKRLNSVALVFVLWKVLGRNTQSLYLHTNTTTSCNQNSKTVSMAVNSL